MNIAVFPSESGAPKERVSFFLLQTLVYPLGRLEDPCTFIVTATQLIYYPDRIVILHTQDENVIVHLAETGY